MNKKINKKNYKDEERRKKRNCPNDQNPSQFSRCFSNKRFRFQMPYFRLRQSYPSIPFIFN